MSNFIQINHKLYNTNSIKRVNVDVGVEANGYMVEMSICLSFDLTFGNTTSEKITLFRVSMDFNKLYPDKYEDIIVKTLKELTANYIYNEFSKITNELRVVDNFLSITYDTIKYWGYPNFDILLELLNDSEFDMDVVSPRALADNKELQTIVSSRTVYVETTDQLDKFASNLKNELISKIHETMKNYEVNKEKE